jgi:glutathione synthase
MRKDPPFDMTYVFTTYLLDMVSRRTLVVNDPLALKQFNEKLWAMRFPAFHPKTLLSRDPAQIRAFVESLPGRAVLKPWDGNGGRGVLVTSGEDRNLGSMIDLLTREGRDYVISQQFIAGAQKGDKRILLFDGDPVGAMLRVPSPKDWRGNMHVGARVEACELDDRDVEICRQLGPELQRWGLTFVGIDVIDGQLTEINVTSPTGIQEINRLYGLRLEQDLVDRVERNLVRRREEA